MSSSPLSSPPSLKENGDDDAPFASHLASPADIEAAAFLAWIQVVRRTRQEQQEEDADPDSSTSSSISRRRADALEDLTDGLALLDVLSPVDPDHFKNPHGLAAVEGNDSFVIRLGTLKRLYRLMMEYYTETLLLTPSSVEAPDLDEISRSASPGELCKLCKLAIGIALNAESTKTEHIAAIQTLSEQHQQALMVAIEQVMSGLKNIVPEEANGAAIGHDQTNGVDHEAFTRLHSDKLELERLYLALMEEHQTLKGSHEEAQAEREELKKDLDLAIAEKEKSKAATVDVVYKGEIVNLQAQLRKSEDRLAEAETEVQRLTLVGQESNKKISDLQAKADESVKLKDQLDEYRHLADKNQRTENTIEKYKKKLEESSGLRLQLKDLESQNADLLQRNSSLEKEYAKLVEFKPLMEDYKEQISQLNIKNASLTEEVTNLKYNADQSVLSVKALEEQRTKHEDELQALQERIEELELEGGVSESRRRGRKSELGRLLANGDDEDEEERGVSVDDGLAAAAPTQDLVPQSQLEEAQRSRAKYEADYWTEHRERLRLGGQLERIRNGNGSAEDETTLALRMRLNEAVEELEDLKKTHAEVNSKLELSERDLTIAKSDLHLVGKDQLEILTTLRAEVGQEKVALDEEVARLKRELASSEDQSRKMASQIQGLLMEKIATMESERASSSSKDVDSRAMSPSNSIVSREEAESDKIKLKRARAFIKVQDKMIKDAQAAAEAAATAKASAPLEGAKRDELVESLKRENQNLKTEQRLMSSAYHHLASTRRPISGRIGGGDSQPKSWLYQQQARTSVSRRLLEKP